MMQLTSRRVDSYHLPERALSCRTPPSQSKIWFKGRTTSVTLFLVNARGNSTQGRRPTMSCLEGEETISCPERPGNAVLPTTAALTFSLLSFRKFLSPQRSSGQFYNCILHCGVSSLSLDQKPGKSSRRDFAEHFQIHTSNVTILLILN